MELSDADQVHREGGVQDLQGWQVQSKGQWMSFTIFGEALALQHKKGPVIHGQQRMVPGAWVQGITLLPRGVKTGQSSPVRLVLAECHQKATARSRQRDEGLAAPLVPFQHLARALRLLRDGMKYGQYRLALLQGQIQACMQVQPTAGALVDGSVCRRIQIQNLSVGRKSFSAQRRTGQDMGWPKVIFGKTWMHVDHHDR